MQRVYPLEAWTNVWHAPYRKLITRLIAAALLAGAVVYFENGALNRLAHALASPSGAPIRGLGDAVQGGVAGAGLLVLAFVVLRLGRAAIARWEKRKEGALLQRARGDLEREVLANLLRKDEAFFADRSPAEISGRLAIDVQRIASSRAIVLGQITNAFILAGNILFFLQQDWRLALTAVFTVGAGAVVMNVLTRPVKRLDAEYQASNDAVKGCFEELLLSRAELRASGLSFAAVDRLGGSQSARDALFQRFVDLNSWLVPLSMITYVGAFAALVSVGFFLVANQSLVAAAALVPVALKALPELFLSASQIVIQKVMLDQAATSRVRVLEYASVAPAPAPDGDDATEIEELVLSGATYRYRGKDGSVQRGIAGVNLRLRRGELVAVVGRSGSGKSTLTKLVLGEVAPDEGTCKLADGRAVAQLSAAARRALMTQMPQHAVVFEGSMIDNLVFGRCDRAVNDRDRELLEALGLADLCRRRALAAFPEAGGDAPPLALDIVGLRAAARRRCADIGCAIRGFESGAVDPTHWIIESLLGGRCDRDALIARLARRRARAVLLGLARSPQLGPELSEIAERLSREQASLLRLDQYDAFAGLQRSPAPRPVWELRREMNGSPTPERRATLAMLVALSCSPAEFATARLPLANRELARAACTSLLREVGVALVTWDLQSIHPYLTWRENIVFGVPEAEVPAVAPDALDDALVALVRDHGDIGRGDVDALQRIGLSVPVGRAGARLSGGQRQLVSLFRVLGRDTPLVVIDEPTAALDPARRDRVIDVLRESRTDRIMLAVTHDPALARASDRVCLVDAGRVVAVDTFDALARDEPLFRAVLALDEPRVRAV